MGINGSQRRAIETCLGEAWFQAGHGTLNNSCHFEATRAQSALQEVMENTVTGYDPCLRNKWPLRVHCAMAADVQSQR